MCNLVGKFVLGSENILSKCNKPTQSTVGCILKPCCRVRVGVEGVKGFYGESESKKNLLESGVGVRVEKYMLDSRLPVLHKILIKMYARSCVNVTAIKLHVVVASSSLAATVGYTLMYLFTSTHFWIDSYMVCCRTTLIWQKFGYNNAVKQTCYKTKRVARVATALSKSKMQ